MYQLTSSGTDSQGVVVVIITCNSCGYFEEHLRDLGPATTLNHRQAHLEKDRAISPIIEYLTS